MPAHAGPAQTMPAGAFSADTDAGTGGEAQEARRARRRAIRLWLLAVAFLVFGMVVLGGATRMTNSGLSIVEWKPVTGAIPPLTESGWQSEFQKYQQIPQYRELNRGMTLGEFQFIYWWEWSHRQLGRLIGIAFALPLLLFWWRGWLEPWLKPRLVGLLALGGSQGALGWWMVASGLSERTDVSQYRLAMHMTLACIILTAILWVARSLAPARERAVVAPGQRALAYGLVALTLLQIFLGGLVAGLDAGLSHNTWPLMDGHFLPPPGDLYVMTPAWRNHFENVLTVQFQHRMVAYALLAVLVWHAVALRRASAGAAARRATALLAIALAQAVIGIMTLLLVVPLWAGLLHQAWAVVLLAMTTVHAQAVWRDAAGPAPPGPAYSPARA